MDVAPHPELLVADFSCHKAWSDYAYRHPECVFALGGLATGFANVLMLMLRLSGGLETTLTLRSIILARRSVPPN